MPVTPIRSGNAVHKIDKYFIHSTERDANGRIKLKLSSAAGYGRLTNTEEIKRKLRDGAIQLTVLSNNEQIKVKTGDAVKSNEERYVIDYDERGVKWTVRELQVFVNPSTNEMSVELLGKVYTIDEFFE